MTEDETGDLDLFPQLPTAMVGEARIVIAEDPRPVEAPGEGEEHCPGRFGQAVAAELVVEAVAEAVEPLGPRAVHYFGQCGKRCLAVIGRQELAEPGVPAGLFEVQVGDQQGAPLRPPQRTLGVGKKLMSGERKGNHLEARLASFGGH